MKRQKQEKMTENKGLFNKAQKVIKDIMPLAACEIAIMLLTILVGGVLDLVGIINFSYKIITGVWLGAVVVLLNYTFLTISVDKAINDYMALRGNKEMDDEEAEKFAKEHSMPIQNAIKTSYMIRTASMLITLVIAFILDWFNPIATAIPLLSFRPLLTFIEGIKSKRAPKPNPEKFIKYQNEKECDD